jgi:hypothetical protein
MSGDNKQSVLDLVKQRKHASNLPVQVGSVRYHPAEYVEPDASDLVPRIITRPKEAGDQAVEVPIKDPEVTEPSRFASGRIEEAGGNLSNLAAAGINDENRVVATKE